MADKIARRVTPNDVTELEREQLRFLLSGSDMAQALVELNPSLSWMPVLHQMNLLKDDAPIAVWVEQNFNDPDAVRDVVANIQYFREESANILEYRLDRSRAELPELLTKCWQLIIRHIRNRRFGSAYREWFEILPRLKQGDHSTEVLERLVHSVTPRLQVEKRFGWYDDEGAREIKSPLDLMSIKYESDEAFTDRDFLSAWPTTAADMTEYRLISMLTHALINVLSDAVDIGLEHDKGFSISDTDVPSVAAHDQNAFRHGLLTIVRVTVELWVRLGDKNVTLARPFFQEWKHSPHRLLHRMALFAATDPHISAREAANVLIELPQGELFLTSSSVEVHRLIRQRWHEFTEEERRRIEARVIDGPPDDWFREGADLDRARDRYRFSLLCDFERSEVAIGAEAMKILSDIRQRHPEWKATEPERDGFMMWHGSARRISGDQSKLEKVATDELVEQAITAQQEEDFLEGDAWQAFAQNNPDKAIKGIERASGENKWNEKIWRPFLWSASRIPDVAVLNRIAGLLSEWPESMPFTETSGGAAWWLDEVADKLDDEKLWTVWDFLFRRAPRRTEVLNDDPFGTALNDTAGHLASILLKKIPVQEGETEELREFKKLPKGLLGRFDQLATAEGTFGLLARVRFSAAISFLFEHASEWCTNHIIPKFDWNSPDAGAMWSARKYSNYIGSRKLFKLTKKPFLELFTRNDVGDEDIRVFADWLAVILIVNRAGKADYPLTPAEARTVLRRGGHPSLSAFAHRLAIDMESAKQDEKVKVWTEIIGPVFQGAWPLDAELQSPKETFKLVQLLRGTGDAFTLAVTVILPFIRAEDRGGHSSVYSISEAPEALYAIAPDKMLELLSAVVGDAPSHSVFSLQNALKKLSGAAPHLVQSRPYQRLKTQASEYR